MYTMLLEEDWAMAIGKAETVIFDDTEPCLSAF